MNSGVGDFSDEGADAPRAEEGRRPEGAEGKTKGEGRTNSLTPRAVALVIEWAMLHLGELSVCWQLAREMKPIKCMDHFMPCSF